MRTRNSAIWVALTLAALPGAVLAQGPISGDDPRWAVIGAVGNQPMLRPYPGDDPRPAGRVDYVYRMARYEITTGEWLEFVNTFSTRSDEWRLFAEPVIWSAVIDWSYDGPGYRWMLHEGEDAARMPVAGISWRDAAMYCNWLHNGKSAAVEAIQDGAYDTSTFYTFPDRSFTDQPTHHPDARYWIPTLDEWLKAVHYDPNKGGAGVEGWWAFPHSSDVAPIGGPPGIGEANFGFDPPTSMGAWGIPVGSYPEVMSPWGLFDASGGASEHLEEILYWDSPDGPRPEDRWFDGSWASSPARIAEVLDDVQWNLAFAPGSAYAYTGLRLASAVPGPSGLVLVGVVAWGGLLRRSRAHS